MKLVARITRNRNLRRFLSSVRVFRAHFCTLDLEIGRNVVLGRSVVFETYRSIPGKAKISLRDRCTLEDGVRIEAWGGNVEIGENTFLGSNVKIYGHGGVSIGPDCLIAMDCKILSSNHAIPPVGIGIRTQPSVLLPTTIGSDVWLGAGVTVLGGVKIGDGAVVGAGAVVTKNLPPYSISVGIPAKNIGNRVCP